jgi:hypothetical protein
MKVNRFVSLAAAVVVTAIQWVAFFGVVPYTQSVPAFGGVVASEWFDGSMSARESSGGDSGVARS